MATVHLARALGAGGFERLVALKVLHPHIAAEPDFVAMFLDEARLAASIRHPNVVATIDVQEEPLFLVMDYVEGPALHVILRELRKRGERVPLDILLRVFLDTLAGLEAAHELKGPDAQPLCLIHRDVSPQNILVGNDGIGRITDFGVARATSRLSSTRGGQVKGKLAYMAPEQIRSQDLDRRVDVYAAGVVLWELLANQPLFRGDSDAAVLAQIIAGPAKHPNEVHPDLPQGIDATCMKALATDRDQRFPSAGAFADALEQAAHEAHVPIASPRAVAAWIKKLGVHETAPATGTALADASSPGSRSGGSGQALLNSTAIDASAEGGKSSTSVGTLVAPSLIAQKRSVWPVIAIVAGVASAVALGGWALTRRGGDDSTNDAPASQPTAPTAPTAALGTTTTSVSASASAPAVAATTAAPSASPLASETAPVTALPPPKTAPSQVKPRSTAFRPGGL